jgi:predicted double-glycine peptidase
MKSPLCYQATEFDCVPTTFVNSLRYLLPKNEIPPEVVQGIYMHSFDTFNRNGEKGKKGTTYFAVQYICNWLNNFGETKGLTIRYETLEIEDIHLNKGSKITQCINNGGVAIIRVYFTATLYHYVLLTSIDKDFVYIFDPYYREKAFKEQEIEIVWDKPFQYNRKIDRTWFESIENKKYAMSINEERECILAYQV